jgi:hypothetical protein
LRETLYSDEATKVTTLPINEHANYEKNSRRARPMATQMTPLTINPMLKLRRSVQRLGRGCAGPRATSTSCFEARKTAPPVSSSTHLQKYRSKLKHSQTLR